jgi:hypothetical protein
MFEAEQLRDEFDQILQAKRQTAEWLERLFAQQTDDNLRLRLAELRSHTQRHVELTERLLELVS